MYDNSESAKKDIEVFKNDIIDAGVTLEILSISINHVVDNLTS